MNTTYLPTCVDMHHCLRYPGLKPKLQSAVDSQTGERRVNGSPSRKLFGTCAQQRQ